MLLSADKVEATQLAAQPAIGVLSEAESLADRLAKAAGQVLPAKARGGAQQAKAPSVESRTALIASLRVTADLASGDHAEVYDQRFLLLDSLTDVPLARQPYRLEFGGNAVEAETDENGYTEPIPTGNRAGSVAWHILGEATHA